MIIDFHSHIKYDMEKDKYYEDSLIGDMGKNEIDKRVVSAIEGRSVKEQNDFILEFSKKYTDKIIPCAVINPKEYNCVQEMKRIVSLGFKLIELDSLEHNYIPESLASIHKIMQIAEEFSIIVNVFTGFGCKTMPSQWAYYLKFYRKLTMVLLHMGTTDFGYGCVDLVIKHKNLYVETSCMYELPILKKAFNNIDKDMFLFGSHYPHKITTCSVHTFDLLKLDDSTLKALYYENAKRILKL